MEKDTYKWLDAIPTMEDKRLLFLIKGISMRIEIVEDKEVLTNLNERLGCLQTEALKRGLSYI